MRGALVLSGPGADRVHLELEGRGLDLRIRLSPIAVWRARSWASAGPALAEAAARAGLTVRVDVGPFPLLRMAEPGHRWRARFVGMAYTVLAAPFQLLLRAIRRESL